MSETKYNFPVALRKMWSGTEVQQWLDENVNCEPESFFDRLQIENLELGKKRVKLKSFMHTEAFSNLPSVEQGLLMVQLEAMNMYQNALIRRIEIYFDRMDQVEK